MRDVPTRRTVQLHDRRVPTDGHCERLRVAVNGKRDQLWLLTVVDTISAHH
jgi:hypothetical protein